MKQMWASTNRCHLPSLFVSSSPHTNVSLSFASSSTVAFSLFSFCSLSTNFRHLTSISSYLPESSTFSLAAVTTATSSNRLLTPSTSCCSSTSESSRSSRWFKSLASPNNEGGNPNLQNPNNLKSDPKPYKVPRSPTIEKLTTDQVIKPTPEASQEILLPSSVDLHNTSEWKVYLYQFDSCPFCRKARSCLDLLRVPYEVVEVHPLSKKELAFLPDYKKVPVLVVESVSPMGQAEGQTGDAKDNKKYIIKDSKQIVHSLMMHANRATPPTEEAKRASEREWIKWSDNVLVQLIVVNIYRNYKESSETFNYLLAHPKFTVFEKYTAHFAGAVVMRFVAGRRKKQFRLSDERRSLYEALDDLAEAIDTNSFLGGETPNEADINIYGIIRSIEGFSCEKDIADNSKITSWWARMRQEVGESKEGIIKRNSHFKDMPQMVMPNNN